MCMCSNTLELQEYAEYNKKKLVNSLRMIIIDDDIH